MRFASAASLVALGLAAACGSTPIPSARMAQTREALGTAEGAGAAQEPQAALHLKMARDAIARAQQSITAGDGDEADRLLAQADIDARLALAMAREAQARNAAQVEIARVQHVGAPR